MNFVNWKMKMATKPQPAAKVCMILGIVLTLLGCDNQKGYDSRWNFSATGAYRAGAASMSPDGSTIVFAWDITGNGDIYMLKLSASKATRLTYTQSPEAMPVYSPDGSKIVFVRTSGGYDHIWVMDASGANETQLTVGRVIHRNPSFSPDGTTIYFDRLRSGGGLALYGESCEMQSDGKGITPLTTNLSHTVSSVSPNGRMLAYASRSPSSNASEMWIVNRVSSQQHNIGFGQGPIFSPDGKTIACFPSGFGHDSIIVMNSDGSDKVPIPVPYGPKSGMAFCHGGGGIIFRTDSSERGGKGGIYLLMLDSKRVKKLIQLN